MITLFLLLVLTASALGYYDLEEVCPSKECFLANNSKFSDKPANKINFLVSKNISDLEVLKVTPNLLYLHLDSCGRDFKMNVFPPITKLDIIDIANCSISELQNYQFENVSNLVRIELAGNSIEILFNETFHKLSRVEYLYLDNNLIKELPEGVFHPLESLYWLGLSNNNITILPKDTFLRNTELRWLSLNGNPLKIVHLDFPIFTSRKIVELDLGDCEELRDLRLSIRAGNLNITNSGVERLQITGSIREILYKKSQITRADLSGTHFQRSLVHDLCNMTSLEWLNLSNFSKGSVYDSYFELDILGKDCTFSNLHSLNVSGNQLSYIPWGLHLLGANITTLDLSFNKLGDGAPLFGWDTPAEEVGNFPNLRFLNMSRNKLKKMSTSIPLFGPNLTILDLSHNLLEAVSLESLATAQNLQSLYLEGNQLTSFDYLSVCGSLKNLKRLILYDNRFNSTFYGNMSKYLSDNDLSAEPRP